MTGSGARFVGREAVLALRLPDTPRRQHEGAHVNTDTHRRETHAKA